MGEQVRLKGYRAREQSASSNLMLFSRYVFEIIMLNSEQLCWQKKNNISIYLLSCGI